MSELKTYVIITTTEERKSQKGRLLEQHWSLCPPVNFHHHLAGIPASMLDNKSRLAQNSVTGRISDRRNKSMSHGLAITSPIRTALIPAHP
jgi:hypothetical protein